jgi:phytoene dehydrogenase-like protein
VSGPVEAIVIGGGVGGLVASIYLRRAGRSVLLLEAQETAGGTCRPVPSLAGVRAARGVTTLHAIDPRVIDELELLKRGLTFSIRDMPLAVSCGNGKSLLLGRDPRRAAQAIAAHSTADAENYKRYRRELFILARALRPWWWEDAQGPVIPRNQSALMERLEVTSAAAYLNGWFESDTLKASLAFDAVAPFEPGSALALVWRAAQEMCGMQGAVAIPKGGPAALADTLAVLAKETGVEIRTGERAARLILDGNVAVGVELESGEKVLSACVLSSLARRITLLDLAPVASAGFAETRRLARSAPRLGDAHIILVLDTAPDLSGADATSARIVIAERLESWLDTDAAAREGHLPDELLMEVVVATAIEPKLAPPGQHVVSLRVRGLPVAPERGWPALSTPLAVRVVCMLERRMKDLRSHITGIHLSTPKNTRDADFSMNRILSPFRARIATPIDGLFLCGAAAEPMDAVSGRAGRLAAGLALAWLSRGNLS